MKAFHFRLASALRWRETQVDIERNRTAATAARLAAITAAIEARRDDLANNAASLTRGSTGDALQSWSAWVDRTNRNLNDLRQHARAAEQTLAKEMKALLKANQDAELLRKVRHTNLSNWQKETDREIEAFAGETFLRQVTIRKRTGA